jgi:hypothetical protein
VRNRESASLSRKRVQEIQQKNFEYFERLRQPPLQPRL